MNFNPPNFNLPNLNAPYIDTMSHKLASGLVERIEEQIADFCDELKEDEAYAVYVLLKDGSRIFATFFGYHNPYLVIVEGTNDKRQETKLLIHMNEIQIVLIKDKKDVLKDRPKIGFQSEEKSSDEAE